jgi:hypothetical protein
MIKYWKWKLKDESLTAVVENHMVRLDSCHGDKSEEEITKYCER